MPSTRLAAFSVVTDGAITHADSGRSSCVGDHVEAVVSRYRGKVQLWQCAARLNMKNDFDQDEGQRLRLAVLTVERIRRVDRGTGMIMTIAGFFSMYRPRSFAAPATMSSAGLAESQVARIAARATHGTSSARGSPRLWAWTTRSKASRASVRAPRASRARPRAVQATRSSGR